MQPYINIVSNFDAKASYVFTYTFLGSERIITNELSIRESKDKSQPVYASQSTKFDKNHTVPEGTLKNGTTYLAKIRVQIGESWSEWSPELEFTCLATPVITFESLDEKNFVYNDDIMMTALYRQEQGEKIKTYQFTLMNQNKVPITNYPTRFPDEKAPSILKERISGLVKGRLYYVGCRIITTNGINFFKTQEFIPHFVAPSLEGIVAVQNQSENGQILVQSYLKQMLGTQTKPFIPNAANDNPGNYTFLNNEWVVIPKEMPLMYTRLGMAKASDWVAKVWCKNILNGIMFDFSKEFGEGDHIQFIKHDDYIVCEKTHGTIKSRTRSNFVKGLGLKSFFLFIKVVEYRIQMKIVPMESVVIEHDLRASVTGSNYGVANKVRKSFEPTLIVPEQGMELTQPEYDSIKRNDLGVFLEDFLTVRTYDLNGRSQVIMSFDMIGMLQKEFGDVAWGGKTSLEDRVVVARRIITGWKPFVYAYSTSAEGETTSMRYWRNGQWTGLVSHTEGDFTEMTTPADLTPDLTITDTGHVHISVSAMVSDNATPSELMIRYAKLVTKVNASKF